MKKQLLAISVVVLIGASACGGGDDKGDGTGSSSSAPAGAASSGSHNAQDVMFAQMMIPHHRQAVEMARVVTAKSADSEVERLAQRIDRAQAPEIETMSGWLRQWGETVPAGQDGGAGSMPGMDHGMPGMMSEKQMNGFGKLKGAALDRRFLTMMIEHHEGAITMAKTERAKGAYPAAKTLAEAIIKSQQAEITMMKGMLKQ